MTSDYEAIREENTRLYGTNVGKYGDTLLRDRYDDRTHFLFELLQNAEDAYGRRGGDVTDASVRFSLKPAFLDVRHYGVEFTEKDVRGVCGIGESTKDEREIGKFGIGFKSVYAYTAKPEVHSGDESFAIEDYVLPHPCEPRRLNPDETLIRLPFRSDDPGAGAEILAALKGLGSSALLFLRHVKEISWSAGDSYSGDFLREEKELDEFASIVTIIGQDSERPGDTDEEWLLFRRHTEGTDKELYVEVAFALDRPDPRGDWHVRQRSQSRLTVFFPTAVDTHCGVAIQGPYETTPSRDNIRRADTWNQSLVTQTATVIVDALRWLRDTSKLTAAALQSLPIRSDAYIGETGSIFAPIYQTVLEAIRREPLLPTADGDFVSAEAAVIGSRDLRTLIDRDQLTVILGAPAAWLDGGITEDRTADLYAYLAKAAEVRTLTPEFLIPRLSREFLEAQDDEWVRSLYEFLGGLNLWRARLEFRPLVRLADGRHVPAIVDGEPTAYLPNDDSTMTGFPLVKREVALTAASREFLQEKLGLVEPDPVEDVIRHVLPKYDADPIDDSDYDQDIRRICRAALADSTSRRSRLLEELGKAYIVQTVDLGTGEKFFARPGQTYLTTQRIRSLFSGVSGVLVVDDTIDALATSDALQALRDAGAVDYLRPIERQNSIGSERRRTLREASERLTSSGINDWDSDWDIDGLDGLLELLPTLTPEAQAERGRLLWEALIGLEHDRGQRVFTAAYRWSHHGWFEVEFPPRFLDRLSSTPWVISDGELRLPATVVFETLGWRAHPFLESKIRFKPAIVDELAVQAGFDPQMLDVLKQRGIRTLNDLIQFLPEDPARVEQELDDADTDEPGSQESDADEDDDLAEDDSISEDDDADGDAAGGSSSNLGTRDLLHWGTDDNEEMEPHDHGSSARQGGSGKRERRDGVRRPRTAFHSFVGVWHDDVDADPASTTYEERMALEDAAIDMILSQEPGLVRMPPGNPGYDLEERDRVGNLLRVVEVKSLRVSFDERPAAISRAQFEAAQTYGAQFWLYIVERAGQPDARVIRLHDPIAQASHFSFDKGWVQVAAQGLAEV